jgi:hypothetical protein
MSEENIELDNIPLRLVSVQSLLKEDFFIPSYQRGYRWTKTQVTQLLDDIWLFATTDTKKEEFYCLQPIVVKKDGNLYKLIDGQQRLTTIYILLTYLDGYLEITGQEKYSIDFETRHDSKTFLEKIDFTKKEDNLDYFHICEAYTTIKEWFEVDLASRKMKFANTLLGVDNVESNVRFIWYNIDHNTSEVEVFTRLNIGKIRLTNAELVKALFLNSSNFENSSSDYIRLRQIQIATEWDYIENSLQQDKLWHFIYQPSLVKPNYATRIEYLLDLIMDKQVDSDVYFTFYEFNKKFKSNDPKHNSKELANVWLDVKQYYLTIEEWYNDDTFYHLIGFLILLGFTIKDIKNEYDGKTKEEFKSSLFKLIKQKINYKLEDLIYKNKEKVRNTLLLFNILTILSNKKSNVRFPFDRYKKENWDIEHVRSLTDKKIDAKYRKDWLFDMLAYFTGVKEIAKFKLFLPKESEPLSLCNRLIELYEKDKIEDPEFNNLFQDLQIYFKEESKPDNEDQIGNLALLDSSTNRSYKNAYFPIKRKIILNKDETGTFVPICTKNVFLKYYSNKVDSMMYWTETDANDYTISITSLLKDFIESPEEDTKPSNNND